MHAVDRKSNCYHDRAHKNNEGGTVCYHQKRVSTITFNAFILKPNMNFSIVYINNSTWIFILHT
jgi:hypothetical protein